MKIQWESENMAWLLYFSLDWKGIYAEITLAGINIHFHIDNIRNVIYDS